MPLPIGIKLWQSIGKGGGADTPLSHLSYSGTAGLEGRAGTRTDDDANCRPKQRRLTRIQTSQMLCWTWSSPRLG